MMRLACLICLTVYAAVASAQVYRWVDEQGRVHFSDRPHPGADTLELPKAQTYTRPSLPASQPRRSSRVGSAEEEVGEPAAAYKSIEIIRPTAEETLWNIGGKLSVALRVTPQLREGHVINIYYDGNRVSGLRNDALVVELDEVWRGTHTLRAAVEANGRELVQSEPITFYVKQRSILNPPARRAPP